MTDQVLNIILTRRSVRNFKDERVPRETLITLLRAGMNAPSACNQQPWSFIAVEDKKILGALSQVHRGCGALQKAPLAIAVCGSPNTATLPQFWQQDCAAATENILLAAHALGLGAVWIGVNPASPGDYAAIREILGIPVEVVPFGFIALGFSAEQRIFEDRYDQAKAHLNSAW